MLIQKPDFQEHDNEPLVQISTASYSLLNKYQLLRNDLAPHSQSIHTFTQNDVLRTYVPYYLLQSYTNSFLLPENMSDIIQILQQYCIYILSCGNEFLLQISYRCLFHNLQTKLHMHNHNGLLVNDIRWKNKHRFLDDSMLCHITQTDYNKNYIIFF